MHLLLNILWKSITYHCQSQSQWWSENLNYCCLGAVTEIWYRSKNYMATMVSINIIIYLCLTITKTFTLNEKWSCWYCHEKEYLLTIQDLFWFSSSTVTINCWATFSENYINCWSGSEEKAWWWETSSTPIPSLPGQMWKLLKRLQVFIRDKGVCLPT